MFFCNQLASLYIHVHNSKPHVVCLSGQEKLCACTLVGQCGCSEDACEGGWGVNQWGCRHNPTV